jgi:hypothetical protein
MMVNWLLDDARSKNNERAEEQRSLMKHKILDLCVLISMSNTMTCSSLCLARNVGPSLNFCRSPVNYSKGIQMGKQIHWVRSLAFSYYCTWA